MSQVFPKAKLFSLGYSCPEVDQFFERAKRAYEGGETAQDFSALQVRSAAFPIKRRGYATGEVDAALDRLESAFVKRDRANHVAVNGQQAWLDHVAQRATTLYPRLLRPAGERFASPPKGTKGYDRDEVDAFLDRLSAFFDEGRPLTSTEIRSICFKSASAKKSYAEGPVDAFLARAIEVLLAVE